MHESREYLEQGRKQQIKKSYEKWEICADCLFAGNMQTTKNNG